MNVKDLRDWLQLLFVVLGGFVALAAYLQNLRQRRVENALKFIGLFRDGLREKDLEHWQDLFIRSSESAGAKPGTFATEDGKYASVGEYFSEESGDGHAISRMVQSLDVVCHQVVTGVADARTIYYELGQLLGFMKLHLSSFQAPLSEKSFLEYAAPSIYAFFKKYGSQAKSWPHRMFAYIE